MALDAWVPAGCEVRGGTAALMVAAVLFWGGEIPGPGVSLDSTDVGPGLSKLDIRSLGTTHTSSAGGLPLKMPAD